MSQGGKQLQLHIESSSRVGAKNIFYEKGIVKHEEEYECEYEYEYEFEEYELHVILTTIDNKSE